jgi:hypothetical protein
MTAEWRKAIADYHRQQRNQRGKRKRGLATVTRAGMVRVNPTQPKETSTTTCCGTCGRDITYERDGKAFEMHWYGAHHDCAECNTPWEACSRCKAMAEEYGPNWESEPISAWTRKETPA